MTQPKKVNILNNKFNRKNWNNLRGKTKQNINWGNMIN